jgi:metal-dependent amidase/aminoacylase/carboxypeptidase family protein
MLKDKACAYIDENRPLLVDVSKEIHSNPELAFKEFKASKLLADELEKAGFNVERMDQQLQSLQNMTLYLK